MKNRVFKIVADQAKNVKKAFENTLEADDIVKITENLIRHQRKKDYLAQKENSIKEILIEKQTLLKHELENEINEMNKISNCRNDDNRKRKREDVINEIIEFDDDEFTDELSGSDNELFYEEVDEDNSLYEALSEDFGEEEWEDAPSKI